MAQLIEAQRYKPEGRRFDSWWILCDFSLTYFFRPHYGSVCNINEYQVFFVELKAAGAWGWKPSHIYVLTVKNPGSLNLVESSEPI